MGELNHPYLVLLPHPTYTTWWVHVKQGSGRQARRNELDSGRVPEVCTRDSLPTVLRLVAAQLETPRAERWQPPVAGLGVPQRGTTGGEP